MLVLTDKGAELISLGSLRDGDATRVKVALETALRPSTNSRVEGVRSGIGDTIGSLGSSLVDVGGGSTEGAGSLAGDVVIEEVGAVLADQSLELVGLGTLGNCLKLAIIFGFKETRLTRNSILVGELFELGVTPSIDDHVGQGGVGLLGAGGCTGSLLLGLEGGEARVATNRCDQLVTLEDG